MDLIIPDEILQTACMSEEELKLEIAVIFFQKGRLTLEQCSRIAGMGRIQFQHVLASRRIPVHYEMADLKEDMKTMRELQQL